MIVRILKSEVPTSAGFPMRGEIVELPELEAKNLIAAGKAEVSQGFADKRVSWPKLNRKMRSGAVLTR
jgi:hypothetical protein